MQVRNCSQCGQLFEVRTGALCPQCFHSLQAKEEKVFDFLRKNGGQGTLEEIAWATGVPRSIVMTMLKRGWFQGEFQVEYACEMCGIAITDGKLCGECRRTIRQELLSPQATVQSEQPDNGLQPKTKAQFHSRRVACDHRRR